MIDLDSANAQQDSQDFATSCLEGQYRIETRPSLFNKRTVNPAVLAIACIRSALGSVIGGWKRLSGVPGGVSVSFMGMAG